MSELQREIENARKKLDDAIGKGCEDETCYMYSVELDRLIEQYITLGEHNTLPVT